MKRIYLIACIYFCGFLNFNKPIVKENMNQKSECDISKKYANKFVDFLNEVIPEYESLKWDEGKFFFDEENCIFQRFVIHDLTNQIISNSYEINDFSFEKGHVYLFYCAWPAFAFCNIAYIDKKDIKFFEALDCEKRGTTKDEVMVFLESNLEHKNKDKILERVRNYKDYTLPNRLYFDLGMGNKVELECEMDSLGPDPWNRRGNK